MVRRRTGRKSVFIQKSRTDPSHESLLIAHQEFLRKFGGGVRPKPLKYSIADFRSGRYQARMAKRRTSAPKAQLTYAEYAKQRGVNTMGMYLLADLCAQKFSKNKSRPVVPRNGLDLAFAIEKEVTFLPAQKTHEIALWIFNNIVARGGIRALRKEIKWLKVAAKREKEERAIKSA
jgi:hypothetical protein